MKKEKTVDPAAQSPYFTRMHRLGWWITLGSLILFVSVPLIVSLVYGVMPKLGDLVLAAGSLSVIFIPLGVAETFAEVPVMGSSYYLSCITGNILNLKLPATMNAIKVSKLEPGSEAADAIIGVATAVSALVTLALLIIGVLLLAPLRSMLSAPAVSTAVQYVLPALFGCLALSMFTNDVGGGIIIKGRLKAAIIPAIICAVLYFFIIPTLYETLEGVIMLVMIPIIYYSTKWLYKRGKIQVELPDATAES